VPASGSRVQHATRLRSSHRFWSTTACRSGRKPLITVHKSRRGPEWNTEAQSKGAADRSVFLMWSMFRSTYRLKQTPIPISEIQFARRCNWQPADRRSPLWLVVVVVMVMVVMVVAAAAARAVLAPSVLPCPRRCLPYGTTTKGARIDRSCGWVVSYPSAVSHAPPSLPALPSAPCTAAAGTAAWHSVSANLSIDLIGAGTLWGYTRRVEKHPVMTQGQKKDVMIDRAIIVTAEANKKNMFQHCTAFRSLPVVPPVVVFLVSPVAFLLLPCNSSVRPFVPPLRLAEVSSYQLLDGAHVLSKSLGEREHHTPETRTKTSRQDTPT